MRRRHLHIKAFYQNTLYETTAISLLQSSKAGQERITVFNQDMQTYRVWRWLCLECAESAHRQKVNSILRTFAAGCYCSMGLGESLYIRQSVTWPTPECI